MLNLQTNRPLPILEYFFLGKSSGMVDLRDPPPPCSGQVPDRNGKTILTLSQQKKHRGRTKVSGWFYMEQTLVMPIQNYIMVLKRPH